MAWPRPGHCVCVDNLYGSVSRGLTTGHNLRRGGPIVEPPAAIVRERTVVVWRPIYVPAPVYRAPLPPYGYVAELGYVTPGW